MDNARYQRCALVRETAERLGAELLFLPPYSPNLNLIERVWRLVKTKTLRRRSNLNRLRRLGGFGRWGAGSGSNMEARFTM